MSQKSRLARQVTLDEAWSSSEHSEICCLIYATQNGWKLPILFEEMGVPYDWALVDFEKGEQRSEGFLSINPNGRIPALIDRAAESQSPSQEPSWSTARLASQALCCPLTMRTKAAPADEAMALLAGQCPRAIDGASHVLSANRQGSRPQRSLRHWSLHCRSGTLLANPRRAARVIGRPFVLGQRCTLVDVACFPYCASAYWANVDISAMSHLLAWIEMLHQRPSFRTGLTVPFSRPAFFGPPYATPEEIEVEIARNAGQFAVVSKSPS